MLDGDDEVRQLEPDPFFYRRPSTLTPGRSSAGLQQLQTGITISSLLASIVSLGSSLGPWKTCAILHVDKTKTSKLKKSRVSIPAVSSTRS